MKLTAKQGTAQEEVASCKRRKPPMVTVVIVNYNTGPFLAEAVDSVITQRDVIKDVVVVDNASTDNSLDLIQIRDGDTYTLRILRQRTNRGFAVGCNIGLAVARSDLVLFLNPDCRMSVGSISKMAEYLEGDGRVGIVGPLILGPDGKEQAGCRRDIPTPLQSVIVLLNLHKIMKEHPRFRHYNHIDREIPLQPVDVHAVSGACMMTSKHEMNQLGAFDERYFLHFEDLDLCLRFLRAGKIIKFLPDVAVTHYKGVSSRATPVRVHWHKHLSMMRFFQKNFFSFYPGILLNGVKLIILIHFVATLPSLLFLGLRRRKGALDKVVDG